MKYKQPLNQTLVTPEYNSVKVIVKCQQSGEIFGSGCLRRQKMYLQIPIKQIHYSLFSNCSSKTVYNGLLKYHIHNYGVVMQ